MYAKKTTDAANAEADDCMLRIQSSQNVVYAAPLAGYESGEYVMNERLVLVTESPKFIQSSPGD